MRLPQGVLWAALFLFISSPAALAKESTLYQMKHFEMKEPGCQAPCASVVFDYPELISLGTAQSRHKIQSTLHKAMLPEGGEIDSYAKAFLAEYLDHRNHNPNRRTSWGSETRVKLETIHPNYLSYSVFHYEFTGGAHGNYSTRYYNFDSKTGEVIHLNQVFKPNYVNRLNFVSERSFRAARQIPARQSLSEAGFDFENNRFQVNHNFLLLDQGLRFFFNVYEISYYAAGPSEFEIYYFQMNQFVSKHNPYTQGP